MRVFPKSRFSKVAPGHIAMAIVHTQFISHSNPQVKSSSVNPKS